jgi:hypothetical protein
VGENVHAHPLWLLNFSELEALLQENRGEQLQRVRDEEKQLFMILLREEEWSRTRIFL